MGDAPEVVREVGINHFRMASEQQRFHLDYRLLGVSPGTVCVLLGSVERHSEEEAARPTERLMLGGRRRCVSGRTATADVCQRGFRVALAVPIDPE